MFSCTQTSAGWLRGHGFERLKDERRHVEIAAAAPVGDLLHPHEPGARLPPAAVGVRLVAEHLVEIRATDRLRRRLGGRREEEEEGTARMDPERGTGAESRGPVPSETVAAMATILHSAHAAVGALMGARQPLAEEPGGRVRRRAVERHQGRRQARNPRRCTRASGPR